MKLKHKKNLIRLCIAGGLVILLVVLLLLKNSQWISEYIFARGLARWYITAVSAVTSVFKFSVFEIFTAVAVISVGVLTVKWVNLCVKNRKALAMKSFLNTLIVALCIGGIYTVTASFSYTRAPLPVPSYTGKILEEEAAEAVVKYYVEDFIAVSKEIERDENGLFKMPYSHDELCEVMKNEYERIGTLDGYLNSYTPDVKKMLASGFMKYQHTTGIAFTVTGEANINTHVLPLWKIHTAAHELAHVKGVMREDDANLLANYMMLTSDDANLRYAFYTFYIERIFSLIGYTADAAVMKEYRAMVAFYRVDRKADSDFWAQYVSPIDKVSTFLNDLYLKISGADDGVGSYSDKDKVVIVPDPNDNNKPKPQLSSYSAVQKMLIACAYDRAVL